MHIITKKLDEAYRRTLFHVRDREFDFVIRIGEFSPEAAESIRSMGGEGASFVTAWNPCGVEISESANRAANDLLKAELARIGANAWKGFGKCPEGTWVEESFFAFSMSRSQAIDLCKKFRQHAVVFIDESGLAELLYHPDAVIQTGE